MVATFEELAKKLLRRAKHNFVNDNANGGEFQSFAREFSLVSEAL
ncbi:MAG: hypothetical protein QG625_3969 [Cyanobacteriota bacterium erpe_2018_sw_39hr_WHONDRS-SW48-000098_B_bin.30]|jgi:hypothetical protein|nr:hypothetical protein [Cyanobacteriota bacterium erpe_2018_sw_39hr_WHONDRS-SW48-000098_B_bin.30]